MVAPPVVTILRDLDSRFGNLEMNDLGDTTGDVALVRQALQLDAGAAHELVRVLAPVVRRRVAQVLLQTGSSNGRQPSREDVDDLQHDVFVRLFERSGRVLRSWSPEHGMSLREFAALVAQREAQSCLRRRRSAWAAQGASTPDTADVRARLLEQLSRRLSPRGQLLFDALYCDRDPDDALCRRFAISAGALQSFRSRLVTLVAQLEAERADARDELETGGLARQVVS